MEVLHPHERAALSERLKVEIDNKIVETHQRGHSWRLGPSSLDDDCNRKIWYGFRWVKRDQREAKMLRLLDHGKLTEPRFDEWLTGIGCQVWEIDPAAPATRTNRQFRIRSVNDHVGGYLDGIAILPPAFNFPYPLVLEKKTSNDKNWKPFEKEGATVAIVKPEHKHQAQYYGWKGIAQPNGAIWQFRYSLYMSLNKNDDGLHVEIIENDFAQAELDDLRFAHIITTQKPPPRISEDATNFKCKMCRMSDVCHKGAAYEKNCRSCEHGEPVPGGEWQCNLRSQVIPRDVVKVGCDHYHPVAR